MKVARRGRDVNEWSHARRRLVRERVVARQPGELAAAEQIGARMPYMDEEQIAARRIGRRERRP